LSQIKIKKSIKYIILQEIQKEKNTHKNLPNKNQSYTIFFHDYQEKSNLSMKQQYSREKQKKPRKFSTKTNRIFRLKEPKKSKSEENPSTQIHKKREKE